MTRVTQGKPASLSTWNHVRRETPSLEVTDFGFFDFSEQLRALEAEKQNLSRLVCDLLRKNEDLRTQLRQIVERSREDPTQFPAIQTSPPQYD